MKNKFWRDPVILFAFRFAVIFGLLIIPSTAWNEAYASYFRGLGQAAFSRDEGNRLVAFSPSESADDRGLDTQITLGNRDHIDASGKGLAEEGGFNTRSIGWVPTALTIALIVATPIPWQRRAGALLGGLILVHAFILFSVQTWIWNNSPGVSLVTFPDWEKQVIYALDYTLLNQIGASFAVPVLIWILVTFNSHDLRRGDLVKSGRFLPARSS